MLVRGDRRPGGPCYKRARRPYWLGADYRTVKGTARVALFHRVEDLVPRGAPRDPFRKVPHNSVRPDRSVATSAGGGGQRGCRVCGLRRCCPLELRSRTG
ncbi:hypothetical protein chiPu_0026615 [Chiloscyllium punctatum]|uniref:Uncharacterized protein n=1 Tax=Chiloscyllium punctatum TaxID=137246 RepID=A0A401TIQ7_CHIPU|nr:hypothetical protein [Chiloscyllium punctatum]